MFRGLSGLVPSRSAGRAGAGPQSPPSLSAQSPHPQALRAHAGTQSGLGLGIVYAVCQETPQVPEAPEAPCEHTDHRGVPLSLTHSSRTHIYGLQFGYTPTLSGLL
eukprot:2444258-Prymnesium_polylepis.1